jgi:hypothetical protein
MRRASDLAVIACHFNPCGYVRPLEHFQRFTTDMARAGVAFYPVELAYDDDEYVLGGRVLRLRALRSRALLWQKEALLNAVVREMVPRETKYVAWVDADVQFLNPRWVERACEELESRSCVAQLFGQAHWADAESELGSVAISSCGRHWSTRDSRWNDFTRSHPGFAWAARADWLREVGLYAHMATGSGDTLMTPGFTGRPLREWHDSQLNSATRAHWERWTHQARARMTGEFGYVEGSLVHWFHGSVKDRDYRKRWGYIKAHDYDPSRDVVIAPGGWLEWSEHASRALIETVTAYFPARREDD